VARVFITGSADGLGKVTAQRLVAAGHEVVLHARQSLRAQDAAAAVPGARTVLIGDLTSVAETKALAEQANALGRFDAVIQNAAVGYGEPHVGTEDGVERVFAVNVLAPYVLAALLERPGRMIFLGSGMHSGGEPDLSDLAWKRRGWNGSKAYADSKLLDIALAFALAQLWPEVRCNAVDPGWVPTKMGGPSAPGDLGQGVATQVWLAVSDDPSAQVSGRYFHHQALRDAHPTASDPRLQDELLRVCAQVSGVRLRAAGDAFASESAGSGA
jgi:NAD(P)-dependent dehydrogenase (short-subunit alcohol dehydrogenase family)